MSNKKILILGANGMIGHKMYQILSQKNNDIWAHFKKKFSDIEFQSLYNPLKIIDGLDLNNFKGLVKILNEVNPDIIINCAGITIRRGISDVISNSIIINSALPHFLEEWVSNYSEKRLIHFSTDCVFSGNDGSYLDNSQLDAKDVYGKTKGLGEIFGRNSLCLRGSMIGRELDYKTELLEWFLINKGKTVSGFSNVIYSGITTVQMAYYVSHIIDNLPYLSGIYNVSSKPISKLDLLNLFNSHFQCNSTIVDDQTLVSKKNLVADNFFRAINFKIPTWDDLIISLKNDSDLNSKYYN